MTNLKSGDVMNSEVNSERKPRLEDSFGGTVEKNIPDKFYDMKGNAPE